MLKPELVQHIVTSTNAYAHSKNGEGSWSTNASELYCFIAVHIYMGIVRLPQLPMYWNEMYAQRFVIDSMARDRFKELLRYFYVTTLEQQQPTTDRLRKIRWFIQQLQHSFASNYDPSKVLTVDEAMVGFKGRSETKQYIRNKPTKW